MRVEPQCFGIQGIIPIFQQCNIGAKEMVTPVKEKMRLL